MRALFFYSVHLLFVCVFVFRMFYFVLNIKWKSLNSCNLGIRFNDINYLSGIHLYRLMSPTIFWLWETDLNIFTRKDAILNHLPSTSPYLFLFFFYCGLSIYFLQIKYLIFYFITKIIDCFLNLVLCLSDLYLYFNLSINLFMPLAYHQTLNE